VSYRCYNCNDKKQVHADICRCGTPGDNLDLKIKSLFSEEMLTEIKHMMSEDNYDFLSRMETLGYQLEITLSDKRIGGTRSRRRPGIRLRNGEAADET